MKMLLLVATLVLTALPAYYVYMPLPDGLREPWKLMLLGAGFRASTQVAMLLSWLGFGHHIHWIRGIAAGLEGLGKAAVGSGPGPGPGVRVSDTTFDGVHVRVYEPPAGGEGQLRRAVLYLHGGGWALGSVKAGSYDSLSRIMSDKLNAVVVSVEYRLYPEVLFPEPYLDCLSAAKYFLSPAVLSRYGVDPLRVAVSGDSAGGNLAAAVAQQVSSDDSVSVKFSVQALIYPVLQALDFHTASYQQNHNMPVLHRSLMVRFWLQYLGADPSLVPLLLANNHSSPQAAAMTPELRARVDWTVLLPPKHRKHYLPLVAQTKASEGTLKAVPGLLDTRAAPLLAESELLGKCPRAYILTCEYDVLKDDGLMYARRLQDAGVTVTSDHYDDGFHGCLTFTAWPTHFEVGRRARRAYISWLQENL